MKSKIRIIDDTIQDKNTNIVITYYIQTLKINVQ